MGPIVSRAARPAPLDFRPPAGAGALLDHVAGGVLYRRRDAAGALAEGVQGVRRLRPARRVDADQAALQLEEGGLGAVVAVRLVQQPGGEVGREQAPGPGAVAVV